MAIEWELILFSLLTSLGVGTFIFVVITEWLGKAERTRLPGAIIALVAVIMGGIASVLHLGHPERAFNALSNLGSSITQEAILIGLTVLAILIYIFLLRKDYPAQTRKILAIIGLVLAVVLALALGKTYVLPARPAWNSWLFPLLFLSSATVLGLFTGYFLTVIRKEEASTVMDVNKAALVALVVQAVVVVAYVVFLAAATGASPTRLLVADLALIFWGGVVIVGLLIPLGMTVWLFTSKKDSLPFTSLATWCLVCVLVGGIALRVLIYPLGDRVALWF